MSELRTWWSRAITDYATWPPISRERLRRIRHRWHRVLVLSFAVGVCVGLANVAFEWITARVLLEHVLELPAPVMVLVPAVGLLLATLLVHNFGRTSPAIADDYLRAYHERPRSTSLRAVVGRISGSIATLGAGGAMGFEGPAIYLGSTIGSWFQQRFRRFFGERDRHALLVAGAAAGVAAIFKAPATGAVFALEVPYQEDTASHAVLPALIAAATSYLTFVVFYGTDRLFQVAGVPLFDATDLVGGIALGIACGFGARLFGRLIRTAKGFHTNRAWRSTLLAAPALAVTGGFAYLLFSEGLTLGPGYGAIEWSLDAGRSIELVAALGLFRALATTMAVAGGGAGGLFIPLVVEGWLLGRFAEGIFSTHTSLFPVIGAAAFLGAGYRTPIAAVVFIAETTGQPGFIVPGLIATAVAQLVMGSRSVTDQQLERRVGSIDRRLEQPVRLVMEDRPPACAPDDRLAAVQRAMGATDAGLVVIEDDERLRGVITERRLVGAPRTSRAEDLVDDVQPTVDADGSLGDAMQRLRATNREIAPVVDDRGMVVGLLRTSALLGPSE